MSTTISIHSFRGGTGKSNVSASLATLIANGGRRVGVIDTDIQSPGIHVLFGLDEARMNHSLNDYLWGKCAIDEAAYDVTTPETAAFGGAIFVIPSSLQPGEIARIVREGYDISLLNQGIRDLHATLELDALLIDTHPGLNEETLLSIAISDALVIILRPDQQDFQGTDVTVTVARRLEVPSMSLVVNKVPASFASDDVRNKVEETYGCDVGAVLPHSDEMMELASSDVFATAHPDHPITTSLSELAHRLMAGERTEG